MRNGRMKMAIPVTSTSTLANPANTSGTFLVGFIFDFVKERQSDLMESELMTSSNNPASLNTVSRIDIDAEQTDAELAHLLMPIWAYQLAAGYLIFISVLGLLMNIVVVLVIVNDPQKMTPLNWMLLNLACSDGLIAGFGTPISAAAALQYDWPFSDELCVAYAMIMSTAGIGSITTLTALALWRCQLVVYCPANRNGAFSGVGGGSAKLGRVQAAVLLTLIWAYSLAVTCPPLFGWGRFDREASHISCSVNWESKMANNRSYILYMFAFGLFVPLVVIICSYVSILRVVKQTGKFKRTMMATLQPTPQHQISDHQPHPTAKKMEQKKGSDAAEKRVTVMVACMVGAFLTAWTPYSILALFETFIGVADHSGGPAGRNMSTTFSLDGQQQFNDNQPTSNEADNSNFFYYYVGSISPAFATIPSLFAKSSAVFNPLIYGLLNTQFRSAWKKFTTRLLGRRCCLYQHSSKKNKFSRNFLNCADGGRVSPSLKQSITVHLSMKEIDSSESQSAYVMANTVGGQLGITLLLHKENQDVMEMRAQHHIHSPSLTSSSCSMADPETSVSIRMKSLKSPIRHPNQEEHQLEHHKLVVVRLVSDSTSCSCINDDHLLPQSTEESAF